MHLALVGDRDPGFSQLTSAIYFLTPDLHPGKTQRRGACSSELVCPAVCVLDNLDTSQAKRTRSTLIIVALTSPPFPCGVEPMGPAGDTQNVTANANGI